VEKPDKDSSWKILGMDTIPKMPEDESPPYVLPDTPPEIREMIEKQKAEMGELSENANSEMEKTEGGGRHKKEYEKGEYVFYRGDPIQPPMPWKVIDVSSKFITIMRDDENNPEIKVAYDTEIFRPEDIPYAQAIPFMDQPSETNMPYNIQPQQINPYQQPNINFQPVINVVGGDNKGTIEAPSNASASPLHEPISMIGGGETNIITKQLPNENSQTPKNLGGNDIEEPKQQKVDFTKNLIIVKKDE
jgi:hypothetical protein